MHKNTIATQFKKGMIPWNKGIVYTKMLGNKHAFRGEARSLEQFRYEARHLLSHIKKCSICFKEKTSYQMIVHHIDENPKNNEINNLQKMCRSCHMKYHYTKIKQAYYEQK